MSAPTLAAHRIGGTRVAHNDVNGAGREPATEDESGVEVRARRQRALQAASKAVFQRVPAQVAVVTFMSESGELHGMTATAICSLSMDPPSLLASVNRSNRTSHAIQAAGRFGINFLSADYVEVATRLAHPGADKAIPAGLLDVGDDWDIPYLKGAFAAVQCDLDTAIERFTHILMIGRITRTHLVDGKTAPLLYIGSMFRGLT